MGEPETKAVAVDHIAIGKPPRTGAVVVGFPPATMIVWPCGCSRIGLGTYGICAEHNGPVFDLLDAQGDGGEVAGMLNRLNEPTL